MKSLFCLLALFIGTAGITFSQSESEDGILWEVSGNGLTTPSYILGTIHIYNDSLFSKKETIKTKLKSCDVVVTEINLTSNDELKFMYYAMFRTASKSMKTVYNTTQYNTIDSVCKLYLDNGLSSFEKKQPFDLLSSLMTSKKFIGVNNFVSIDMEITQMARIYSKQVHGLETFKYQDSLIQSISDSSKYAWLYEFCSDLERSKSEIDAMFKAYQSQSSIDLYNIDLKSHENSEIDQVLLIDRNNNWVKFLNNNMKNVSIFMAVGAGHLQGKNGLIPLLRASGYTLTPVFIK